MSSSSTRLYTLLPLFFILGLAGCGTTTPFQSSDPGQPIPKIVGIDDSKYFVDEHGHRFFPWGLNYTNPTGIGLIDDDLYSEETWWIIDQDFAEMKALSANVVRVHLQYHRFMLDAQTPDMQAFAALDRLTDVAERHSIYLLITGLGAFRKSDSPAWYDNLPTDQRWETQALFWQTLARQVGHSGAVFAYDLMNEPVVSACPPEPEVCEWQLEKSMEGLHFAQNITLDRSAPYEETMSQWTNKLHEAVRTEDKVTLTTVGHIGLRPLSGLNDNLDFQSIHIYPKKHELFRSINKVKAEQSDRPLLISEYFNLKTGVDDLVTVLDAIEGDYQGLIGHYKGKTKAEHFQSQEVGDHIWGVFLKFFVEQNPNDTRRRR